MRRRQLELKEKIRREIMKIIIRLLNDLNLRMNQDYNFMVEDLVEYIFELATLKEEKNENTPEQDPYSSN